MNTDIKSLISEEISFLSDYEDRLGELLSYCLGRLSLKSALRGEDWREKMYSIDVPHVVDWLKSSIISNAHWLDNLDDKGRPKKLMKFGSFDDIQKEADKSMRRVNQQNSNIKLVEGDEELYMQLEDGYHLVKLLTATALDREGAKMQHCIGGGAYDSYLVHGGYEFLSLRDKSGSPHVTIMCCKGTVLQFQGKQNKSPSIKYAKALYLYFSKPEVRLSAFCLPKDYVVLPNGLSYSLSDLPDGLEVKGSLDFSGSGVTSLPNNLNVLGAIDIGKTLIASLPRGLKSGKGMYFRNTSINSIPDDIEIGSDLEICNTLVESLPDNLKIPGSLSANQTPLTSLPNGLDVGEHLNLVGSSVTSLPSDLKVGGDIILSGSKIFSLPNGLIVKGSLKAGSTPLASLPKGLEVRENLTISNTNISELPEDIKVLFYIDASYTNISRLPDGIRIISNIDLSYSKLSSLPDNLEIGGDLNLTGTPISQLPSGLKVKGSLFLKDTQITHLPDDIEVGGLLVVNDGVECSIPDLQQTDRLVCM